MQLFIDVSNNNGPNVDFAAARHQGAVAVYLKVTEGTGFVDPYYQENYKRAKAAGLKVGGYHFGHPANSPTSEADFFLSHLRLEPGDLLPCLDLEVSDSKGAAGVHAFASAFVRRVCARTGAWPVRYGGSYFFKANAVDTLPGPAWIASYGAPPIGRWDAWQFTNGEPKYPGSILGLDTSRTPSIWLLVYKAPAHRKVEARIRRAIAAIPANIRRTPKAVRRYLQSITTDWRPYFHYWLKHRKGRKR